MNRINFKRIFFVFAICLSLLVSSPPKSALAQSTTITFNVNSTDDRVDANPGDGVCATSNPVRCTLRAATMEATSIITSRDTSIFIFLEPTTYTLTLQSNNTDIRLSTVRADNNVKITIEGNHGVATIQGDANWSTAIISTDSTFNNDLPSNTTLRNLIIQNGHNSAIFGGGFFENVTIRNSSAFGSSGGGILTFAPLTCLNCVITNNSASSGGGIFAFAPVTCLNCVISNNSASSGGGVFIQLFNDYTIPAGRSDYLFQNTIISDNQAYYGGGIFLRGEDGVNSLKIDKTTIARNQAEKDGGGIFVDGEVEVNTLMLQLFTSTISGNTAKGNGGGVMIDEFGIARILDSTIAFNNADVDRVGGGDGGGIFVFTPEENFITNTILAGNEDLSSRVKHRDCSGIIESGGYNLLQSPQGCTFTGSLTGNILNQSPNLLPLDFYLGNDVTQTPPQGLTPTHAYPPGSLGAGVDDGNPAGCIGTTAQNGVSRHLAATGGGGPGNCDIGAFELVGPDL